MLIGHAPLRPRVSYSRRSLGTHRCGLACLILDAHRAHNFAASRVLLSMLIGHTPLLTWPHSMLIGRLLDARVGCPLGHGGRAAPRRMARKKATNMFWVSIGPISAQLNDPDKESNPELIKLEPLERIGLKYVRRAGIRLD